VGHLEIDFYLARTAHSAVATSGAPSLQILDLAATVRNELSALGIFSQFALQLEIEQAEHEFSPGTNPFVR